ncbi:putative odorant receptor 71a isoform X2 [Drosophila willistoni]|uniref:putative odorant receptor 71a isoform X2 n=1 Tax=Drosophila willistoni TaxID=7260 RepID=UPI000C26C1B1|nr:putative odorant receptor 71a isoform X2 [Drosophila willistoni]
MDFDNIQPARILVGILAFCGLWPDSKLTQDSIWARRCCKWQPYIVHFFITLVLNFMMWMEALLSKDFMHTADVLFITLTETALICKILNNWHYTRIANSILLEWSQSERFILQSREEQDLVRQEQRKFIRITIVYFICSLGVVPCIFLSALLNYPNELPFWMWVPFDWQQPRLYWYPYFYELVAVPFTCLSNITMDQLNCYLMLQLSLYLRVLGTRLSRLNQTNVAMEDELYFRFIQLVQLHRRLKEQANEIQAFISKSTLIQILLSVLNNPGQFAAMAQYLFAMTMQIYLPSIYGNAVTYYCSELPNALYSSEWPDMSVRMRRMVYSFMICLNQPMNLTAGGFFCVGLPLFTKILNQSYSLLALLLNMNK